MNHQSIYISHLFEPPICSTPANTGKQQAVAASTQADPASPQATLASQQAAKLDVSDRERDISQSSDKVLISSWAMNVSCVKFG